ncbi:lazarillo protein-like [Pomacea canaliculata]|uniref:lazarillo protein-like n=1 Tax=Pomacea canaliculata TaxID=400727 RepID=UPI000D72B704|nr:lazarillo protein-like [Pomacea canaliculata]
MAVLRVVSMLVLLWSPVLQKVGCQAPCTLEDVVTLSDFNLTRFLGKWNEVQWIAPAFEDQASMWTDYYHEYNSDDYGQVTGYYSGKSPSTGQCFINGVMLLPTNNPGKLFLYQIGSKSMIDYWVLNTDYTSYAIVYSCVARTNNTCDTARSWLWGRMTSLPEQVKENAKTVFQNLCMNLTLLYSTTFSTSCVPQNKDPCASGSPGLAQNGRHTWPTWIIFFNHLAVFTCLHLN